MFLSRFILSNFESKNRYYNRIICNSPKLKRNIRSLSSQHAYGIMARTNSSFPEAIIHPQTFIVSTSTISPIDVTMPNVTPIPSMVLSQTEHRQSLDNMNPTKQDDNLYKATII